MSVQYPVNDRIPFCPPTVYFHQHADGHRADSAGYGGDVSTFGSYLVEFHIAIEAESVFLRSVGDACRAHVDDRSSLFHHVGRDEIGLADSSYDNVRLTAFFLQVAAPAVAYGHRGVAILLLHHKLCHRFAYDVAAAQDDTFLAARLDMVTPEQFQDAFRGG